MTEARARMRRCLQCPCHGDPGAPIVDDEIEAVHVALDRLTGSRPETCLWWQMRDPIVGEVLELYRACLNGMGATPALAAALDPSNRAWEGLLHYAAVHDRVRAEERRLERENDDQR